MRTLERREDVLNLETLSIYHLTLTSSGGVSDTLCQKTDSDLIFFAFFCVLPDFQRM